MQQFRQKLAQKSSMRFTPSGHGSIRGSSFSHAAPATVFLQYASQETFLNPERARAYAAIVSEPNRFNEYDAPHALNAEARHAASHFLLNN
jgi:hypothetical protein